MVEEDPRKDPGLPLFGFEEELAEKELEKEVGKSVQRKDDLLRCDDQLTASERNQVKTAKATETRIGQPVRRSQIETKLTKQKPEANYTNRPSRMLCELPVTSKIAERRIEILSKFPEAKKLKLRLPVNQAVQIKMKK